eukprot:6475855-Amphidinium_carterae.1
MTDTLNDVAITVVFLAMQLTLSDTTGWRQTFAVHLLDNVRARVAVHPHGHHWVETQTTDCIT